MNIAKLSSKLLLERAEQRLLIVCPITGIISAMDIPAIPDFFLEQINPISTTSNLFKLSQLEQSILLSLEKPLLAGILLGIYKSINLVESTGTSASEQNLLLQSVNSVFLIESIKFFSSTSTINKLANSRKIKQSEQAKQNDFFRNEAPMLRIEQKDCNEIQNSSMQSVIRNYKKDVQEFLFPTPSDNELAKINEETEEIRAAKGNPTSLRIAKAILAARRTAATEQAELLKEARKLNSLLFKMEIINVALNNFIKLLLAKDNLKTADSAMKARATKALRNKNTPDSIKLANLIEHKAFISLEDSLFAGEDDIEVAEAMAELPMEEETNKDKPKSNLKEILERKRLARLEAASLSKQEQAELKLAFPIVTSISQKISKAERVINNTLNTMEYINSITSLNIIDGK